VSGLEGLTEEARNQLLRRVDWRFLLRQEAEPRVHGLGNGDLARAVELVSRSAAEGERTDLAVMVDPGRRALADAFAALEPGGSVYAEWTRPQVGGMRRVRRRLEASGFEDVRRYWHWPRHGRGQEFWLPLDAPGAIGFFLAPRRFGGSRSRGILTVAWAFLNRLGLLFPVSTIARKPGHGLDAVERAALDRSNERTPLSWILLSGGRRRINKVIGLGFLGKGTRPALVVKFARTATEESLVEHESRVLQELERSRPGLAGAPRALFLERRCGRLALGETALEGEPLIWRLDRASFGRMCSLVTAWLVELAGRGQERVGLRTVEEPLERFARDYAALVAPEEIERAHAALSQLAELPSTFEQRDCSPWNVLLSGERVSVADWESAEPQGLPVLDLVYFLTHAALHVSGALDRGPAAPCYLETLDPHTALGAVVARCETLYCDRVGIDPVLVPSLRLLCWTIHTRSEHARFELDAAGPPPPQLLQVGRFFELWRAELVLQT
jgi:hypothetical protein